MFYMELHIFTYTLHWRHNGAMASQITSLTIVYSTVYSGVDKKTIMLRVTGLYAGNAPVTGKFPAQMASNSENVSIWWRHHVYMTGYWIQFTGLSIHQIASPKTLSLSLSILSSGTLARIQIVQIRLKILAVSGII